VPVEAQAGSGQAQTQQEVIVIQPAQPDTVYVPSYDPGVVYGSAWPSSAYPPYYAAPPTGYYFGAALATGVAFAAGAAVVGGLWGLASPGWGGGYANVNVNQFNSINANRGQISSSRWGAGAGAARPGTTARAAGGPVGLPGRSQVSVPGNAVRPPTRAGGVGGAGGAGRPGVGGPGGVGGAGRLGGVGGPGGAGGVGGAGRPGGVGGPAGVGGVGGAGRPGGAGGVGGVGGAGRPGGVGSPGSAGGLGGAGRPGGVGGAGGAGSLGGAGGQRPNVQRPSGAFGDMNSGRQANQFGQRGAQSRSVGQQQRSAGGARGGGGGFSGGGGARGGGGGGGARGGGGGGGRGGGRR